MSEYGKLRQICKLCDLMKRIDLHIKPRAMVGAVVFMYVSVLLMNCTCKKRAGTLPVMGNLQGGLIRL